MNIDQAIALIQSDAFVLEQQELDLVELLRAQESTIVSLLTHVEMVRNAPRDQDSGRSLVSTGRPYRQRELRGLFEYAESVGRR